MMSVFDRGGTGQAGVVAKNTIPSVPTGVPNTSAAPAGGCQVAIPAVGWCPLPRHTPAPGRQPGVAAKNTTPPARSRPGQNGENSGTRSPYVVHLGVAGRERCPIEGQPIEQLHRDARDPNHNASHSPSLSVISLLPQGPYFSQIAGPISFFTF